MHQFNVMVTDDMLEEFVTNTTCLYFSILRRGCNTGYEATTNRRTTVFRRYSKGKVHPCTGTEALYRPNDL